MCRQLQCVTISLSEQLILTILLNVIHYVTLFKKYSLTVLYECYDRTHY